MPLEVEDLCPLSAPGLAWLRHCFHHTRDFFAYGIACLLSSCEAALLFKMQLQHKGAGKGKVQSLVSSWKQEPEFLIRENCEEFRSFGQNPEETSWKEFKLTSCWDCSFASRWDLCLDYQLVPALLRELCKGGPGSPGHSSSWSLSGDSSSQNIWQWFLRTYRHQVAEWNWVPSVKSAKEAMLNAYINLGKVWLKSDQWVKLHLCHLVVCLAPLYKYKVI